MSLLLGIDTATITVSAAIVRDGVVLGSFVVPGSRRQTESLHPGLDLLLRSTGLAPRDLDGVVVDVGPGRFTGVRVGVAAAKGLALGGGIGAFGVTSTAVLLEGVRTFADDAVAVVDLRRGEVAVGFSGEPDDLVARMTPDALGASLLERGATSALLVGDGASEYLDAIARAAGRELRIAGVEHASPSAVAACQLIERTAGGAAAADPSELTARYLRGADVRLGWSTRDGSSLATRMEVG